MAKDAFSKARLAGYPLGKIVKTSPDGLLAMAVPVASRTAADTISTLADLEKAFGVDVWSGPPDKNRQKLRICMQTPLGMAQGWAAPVNAALLILQLLGEVRSDFHKSVYLYAGLKKPRFDDLPKGKAFVSGFALSQGTPTDEDSTDGSPRDLVVIALEHETACVADGNMPPSPAVLPVLQQGKPKLTVAWPGGDTVKCTDLVANALTVRLLPVLRALAKKELADKWELLFTPTPPSADKKTARKSGTFLFSWDAVGPRQAVLLVSDKLAVIGDADLVKAVYQTVSGVTATHDVYIQQKSERGAEARVPTIKAVITDGLLPMWLGADIRGSATAVADLIMAGDGTNEKINLRVTRPSGHTVEALRELLQVSSDQILPAVALSVRGPAGGVTKFSLLLRHEVVSRLQLSTESNLTVRVDMQAYRVYFTLPGYSVYVPLRPLKDVGRFLLPLLEMLVPRTWWLVFSYQPPEPATEPAKVEMSESVVEAA